MSEPRKSLSDLITAHLAGELDEAERSELNELLRTNPEARAEFAAALRRDVLLGEVLREEAAVAGPDPSPATHRAERDSRVGRRAQLQRQPQSAWIPAVVAAALLAGAIGLVIFLSTDPPRPPDRTVDAAPPRPEAPPRTESPNSEPAGKAVSRTPERSEPAPKLAGGRKPVPVEAPRGKQVIEPVPIPPRKTSDEPERKAPPAPVREGKEPPAKRPLSPPPTVSTVAVVDRLEGEAFVVTGKTPHPARAGTEIAMGQGFRTSGPNSAAAVRFPDGTRLELAGDTRLRDFSVEKGKRLLLERGVLRVDAVKQPAGRPLVVVTPHSEARVIGTRFVVTVEPGKTGSTRVAVETGKVRVFGPNENWIDVRAGRYTVVEPATKKLRDGRVAMFQDGLHPLPAYAGTRDSYIAEEHPASNYTHQTRVHVDGHDSRDLTLSGLLRWDLKAIPKGSRVHAVSITLHVKQPTSDAYGIYRLGRGWTEKEVTWNCPSIDDFWQEPGAKGPQDRDASPVATLVPWKTGISEFFLGRGAVDLVQSWIDNPSVNYGIILAGSESGGWIFTSRESAVEEHRPGITVYFQPPGRR